MACFYSCIFTFLVLLRPSSSLPPIAHESLKEDGVLSERAHSLYRGNQFIQTTCSSSDLQAVENAILGASYLAGAGLNAAKKFSDLPFGINGVFVWTGFQLAVLMQA